MNNKRTTKFQQKYNLVKEYYFSRNPKYWGIFGDEKIQSILKYRLKTSALNPTENFPNSEDFLKQFETKKQVPTSFSLPDKKEITFLDFITSTSKIWESSQSIENVITMPSDPALYGCFLGLLANPNLVYKEYAGISCDLERLIVKQIAKLVSYNVNEASGIFTQGGTFCNLYGYLFGLRKSLPQIREFGIANVKDYRIINSRGGHYSNITNLSVLGIDVKNKVIRINIDDNNRLDIDDLETHLRSCFQVNCVVPTIMLTAGTTDTFGVDPIREVYELRNRLCEEFSIDVKPHIHVDAAVGWSIIFFLNYDFENNPLAINQTTLFGLKKNVSLFQAIKHADSFTLDFHKWGYVPYTSSLVMVKNYRDWQALENDPQNFSYFEKAQGMRHYQHTVECSRGAVGMYGAFTALKYMGVEGYQIILAHCLQNANYMREHLSKISNIKVIATENYGPNVGFRIYEKGKNAEEEFDKEINYFDRNLEESYLQRNTDFHRQNFLARGKKILFSNWVQTLTHTHYDKHGKFLAIAGEKFVFMNPNTQYKDIDQFIKLLQQSLEI